MKDRWKIGIIFVVLLFLFALRFWFFDHNASKYSSGQFVSFETTLFSEPQVPGNTQRFLASIERNEKILVVIPRYPQFHYGDTIRVSGTLKDRVINNKKIGLVVYFPKIEAVKKEKNIVLAPASFIRQKVTILFQNSLPNTSASLLLGIVFGVKEQMPKEFMDNLRTTGVLHIIAASGMNVALLAGFLSSIFVFFFKRQVALMLTVLGILFYAVLAGLEPSILRASIMGILAFSAQILGRQNTAFFALLIAGWGMLMLWPSLLLDIGFQLSFAATLGLIYLRPLFDRSPLVKKLLERSIIGESAATTVAAQAATLPILLSNFGTYSFWSIVTNALVLWVVPTLMVLGGVGAVVGIIVEPLGIALLYFSLPFLLYFQSMVTTFAGFGGFVSFSEFPWQFSFGYYLLLLGLVVFFYNKKDS